MTERPIPSTTLDEVLALRSENAKLRALLLEVIDDVRAWQHDKIAEALGILEQGPRKTP